MKKVFVSLMLAVVMSPVLATVDMGTFINPGEAFSYGLKPVNANQEQHFKCDIRKYRTRTGVLGVRYENFVPSEGSVHPGNHKLEAPHYVTFVNGVVNSENAKIIFTNTSENAAGIWVNCYKLD
jgi:hypothetical protein